MNSTEFREQFNLVYNNAASGAPGLDNFEISSYLTKAQLSIVQELYTSSFEGYEFNRRSLNELVIDEQVTDEIVSNRGLTVDSKFYELSNNVMFMVIETATLDGKVCEVKPTTHDDFVKSYNNPFRTPNKRKAWRIDLSKQDAKTTVELVSKYPISKYQVRYVKYPDPIIVSNLETDSEVGGLGLTIDGNTEVATSVLNPLVHPSIVEKAVNLAVRDYRDGTLQAKVQIK
jgi:hypothetical protein